MNKQEWKKELNKMVAEAESRSSETAQSKMLKSFKKDELKRLELFNETENVGYKENLIELAEHYQGSWSYEHNANLTPIF